MLKQSGFLRLGALGGAVVLSLTLWGAVTAHAETVAYWDFEDGVAGQPFTAADQENGSGGSVDTVNGILMRGWNPQFGPAWSDTQTSRPESNLSAEFNGGQDGYVTEGALHNWAPTAWTIETSVYLESLAGWNSLIGRQGSSVAVVESDLYLQNNGIDDAFRINFLTEGGQRWILDSTVIPVANKWYGLAVKSDGVTLSMWMDDGNGYQQVGSLDMSAQTPAQNALRSSALDWTFGRSWFDGNNVDQINGFLDDIRFSDVALPTQDLIGINPAPAPFGIEVNKSTGAITLRNFSDEPLTVDYYLIESAGNALNVAGWNSLSDQGVGGALPADFNGNGTVDAADLTQWQSDYGVNGDSDADGDGDSDGRDFLIWQRQFGQVGGEAWDEAGGVSASQLAELSLSGGSTIGPGESYSLGNAYNTSVFGGADGDLTIQYATAGGALSEGRVTYVGALAATTAVPEPSSFAMVALGLLAALGCRRPGC